MNETPTAADLSGGSLSLLGRWLEELLPADAAFAPPDLVVGPEVGRGGMGVVYRAEQTSLRRPVALKVLLAGAAADPATRTRFRTEGETVARLRHPNILEVYEVGESGGLPYLVTEFLAGGNLHRRLAGQPPPPPVAARLVRTLAGAVEAAHRAGVIHRDLKPSNVLLADAADLPLDRCTVKICDFALAKRLDADGPTLGGEILGTPNYMAPEQAAGKARRVGPTADVYGLGAILYECLTGRPPFIGADPVAVLALVRDDEPIPPRTLNRAVPRDLDTICLKCLEKDPARRYPSAAALADDLTRFLDGRPVGARPVGRGVRLARWCRRYPAVAALLLALTGLCVALAGMTAIARRERDLAREARRRADGNLRHIQHVTDAVLAKVGERRVPIVPAAEELQRDLLIEARRLHEIFLEENPDSPTARPTLAATHLQLGATRHWLGDFDQAHEEYERAAAHFEVLVAASPHLPHYRRGLIDAYLGLAANGLVAQPMPPRVSADAALDRARRVWDQAPADFRAGTDGTLVRAQLHEAQAALFAHRRRHGEAVAETQRAVALREGLLQKPVDKTPELRALALAHDALGGYLLQDGRPAEAVAAHERSLALHRARPEPDSKDLSRLADFGVATAHLARTRRAAGDATRGQADGRRAAHLFRRLVEQAPGAARYRDELAGVLFDLADDTTDDAERRRLTDEALRHARRAAELAPSMLPYRFTLLKRLAHTAEAASRQGRHATAAALATELSERSSSVGDTLSAATLLSACADAAEQDETLSPAGRKELSERYCRQARDLVDGAIASGRLPPEALRDGSPQLRQWAETTGGDVRRLARLRSPSTTTTKCDTEGRERIGSPDQK